MGRHPPRPRPAPTVTARRSCASGTFRSATPRCLHSAVSRSTCPRARSSPCSATTAPASPRCCAPSPGRSPSSAARSTTGASSSRAGPGRARPRRDRARRASSRSPRGGGSSADLTVEENLRAGGLAARDRPRASGRGAVYELFPMLGERARQRAGLLSGGEQQMLAIGRALMAAPRCSCSTSRRSAWRRGWSARSARSSARSTHQGVTVVLVEQNAAMALAVADRARRARGRPGVAGRRRRRAGGDRRGARPLPRRRAAGGPTRDRGAGDVPTASAPERLAGRDLEVPFRRPHRARRRVASPSSLARCTR